jgi:hypothetical protein
LSVQAQRYSKQLKLSGHSCTSALAGATINSDATVDFNGTIHGRFRPGLVFTVIGNRSANPITGTFSNLLDSSTIVLADNTF